MISQKIDVQSQLHRGNFQYQRLPFGVKSAPGIFQSIMDKILAGLSFAMAYLDDIIIVSHDTDEHRNHLKEVFARIKDYGFHLRLEKCNFFMNSVKYVGFIIDKKKTSRSRKSKSNCEYASTNIHHNT